MGVEFGKLKLLKIFFGGLKSINVDFTSVTWKFNYFIFFWIEPINLPEL